jgi:alkylhydroperoxidase/carboxymuconolactone decarboxylase family protein YurZ
MHDPLHAAFELAAAVHCGEPAATRHAAQRVELQLGEGRAREVLRVLHLFYGVPKIVQALNACLDVLPTQATQSPTSESAASPADRQLGEAHFRQLYAEHADRVLQHLALLDPTLCGWILDHAYARGLLREGLSIAQSERLAVLCLAATGCWKQWESHVAIAERQGVSRVTLLADCAASEAWLGQPASRRAQAELTGRTA